MARSRVRLNHGGMAALARSEEMQKLVADAAERIAAEVRGQHIRVGDFRGNDEVDLPVKVDHHVTDRAHAIVMLAHPAGVAVQAKHGALTKAASAIGVNVKGGV